MDKFTIYTGITIGGLLGGYLPTLIFDINPFSITSLFFATLGSFVGLYIGFKLTQ